MRTLLLLRGVMTVLVATLAVVSFVDDHVVVGVLLSAMAITNVVLISHLMHRRRAFRARFPGFAATRDPVD
jgi:hypothetical protein